MQSRTVLTFGVLFTISTLAVIIIPCSIFFGFRLKTDNCQILSCKIVNTTYIDNNYNSVNIYDLYTVFQLTHNNLNYIGNTKKTFNTFSDAQNYCHIYLVGSNQQCYYYKNSIANTLSLSLNSVISTVVILVSVFGGLLLLLSIFAWVSYIIKDCCCCDFEVTKYNNLLSA